MVPTILYFGQSILVDKYLYRWIWKLRLSGRHLSTNWHPAWGERWNGRSACAFAQTATSFAARIFFQAKNDRKTKIKYQLIAAFYSIAFKLRMRFTVVADWLKNRFSCFFSLLFSSNRFLIRSIVSNYLVGVVVILFPKLTKVIQPNENNYNLSYRSLSFIASNQTIE